MPSAGFCHRAHSAHSEHESGLRYRVKSCISTRLSLELKRGCAPLPCVMLQTCKCARERMMSPGGASAPELRRGYRVLGQGRTDERGGPAQQQSTRATSPITLCRDGGSLAHADAPEYGLVPCTQGCTLARKATVHVCIRVCMCVCVCVCVCVCARARVCVCHTARDLWHAYPGGRYAVPHPILYPPLLHPSNSAFIAAVPLRRHLSTKIHARASCAMPHEGQSIKTTHGFKWFPAPLVRGVHTVTFM